MSNYQEENGELLLPSGAVVDLRNALTVLVNTQRAKTFELAEKVHAYLTSEAGAADRKKLNAILRGKPIDHVRSVEGIIESVVEKLNPPRKDRWGYTLDDGDDPNYEKSYTISRLLFKRNERGVAEKLQAPKKKDYPLFPSSKTWEWEGEEFFVRIDPKTRVLTWSIPQKNRSVDRAHGSPLGRVLFGALDKMEWTRGTGGVSRYSDEYMREADMEHGGGGSRESGYGPKGKQMMEARWAPLTRRRTRKA